MNGFTVTLNRELRLGVRRPSDALNPMAFFLIVITIFSLGLSSLPDAFKLEGALAVIWVSSLFSTFLPLERSFHSDFQDGSLELILVHQQSLFPTTLGYFVGRWLFNALPILLLLPIAAFMLDVPSHFWLLLICTISLGSVVFVVLGLLGASLTVGVERFSVLVALLILPLYLPVILMGIGVVQQFSLGEAYGGPLASLAAIAIGTSTFVPFAIATMLRHSLEY